MSNNNLQKKNSNIYVEIEFSSNLLNHLPFFVETSFMDG